MEEPAIERRDVVVIMGMIGDIRFTLEQIYRVMGDEDEEPEDDT